MKNNTNPSLKRLDGETPGAYQAFLDYMALDAPRSVPKLVDKYANKRKKGYSERSLQKWHGLYTWKARELAYLDTLAEEVDQENREWFAQRMAKVKAQAEKLDAIIDTALEEVSKSKISRRVEVDDPNTPGRKMQVVYMRVNGQEIRAVQSAFSAHNKDMREILGMGDAGTSINIKTGGKGGAVKAYVTVTDPDGNTFSGPDAWPEPGELPDEDEPEAEESAGDES